MDRVTHVDRLSDIAIAIINDLHTERLDYQSEYLPLIDAADSLADYEDTGLTPEEIRGLCEMDKRSKMAKMLRWEEAESNGSLAILPCKLGTTVWYITNWGEICKAEVASIEFSLYTNPSIWLTIKYFSEYIGKHEYKNKMDFMLGKTVFLSYEGAEEALNKSGGEK